MQLNEFTKKFLPDYKELFGAYKNEYGWEYNSATYLLLAFSSKYFPEALQNFADRICAEQCKNCAEYYQDNVPYEQRENWMYNGILEAEQPKIDKL